MDGYMLEIGLIPTEIWHSPILRAKHTAEVIAKDFNVPLKEELSLGDNFDEIDLVEKFSEAQAGSCIFLVSHGPQLMRLSTYLLGRSIFKTQIPTSSALVIEFQKQVGERKGIFVKIVQPEMVLRLKGKPI
jgi:phosphohistidine phosphatase SixA